MNKPPFSPSPDYLRYVQGVRDLHALIRDGRDDSPEAEAIRDRMDHPWYNLTETEKERIQGLSADLYSLSDPPREPLPTNRQVQRLLIEAGEAREAGNWDHALHKLREGSRHIDPSLLSTLRGEIWQAAGDEATATLFFIHAASLTPVLAEQA